MILFLETCQESQTSAWYYSAGRQLSRVKEPNILKKDLYYYHYCYCNYYYLIIIIIAIATGNDDEISKNFWGCAKNFSNPAPLFPSFNAVQGTPYFTETFKRINRMKVFTILDAQIKRTEYSFNLSPPSYQEITQIIKGIKSSGSTMSVRPDVDNLFQAMSIIKFIHVRYLHCSA